MCTESKVENYFNWNYETSCRIRYNFTNQQCLMYNVLPSLIQSAINCKGYSLWVWKLLRCDSIKETQFLKWSINMADMNDEGSEIKQNGHTSTEKFNIYSLEKKRKVCFGKWRKNYECRNSKTALTQTLLIYVFSDIWVVNKPCSNFKITLGICSFSLYHRLIFYHASLPAQNNAVA